jgi:hypothetical protein
LQRQFQQQYGLDIVDGIGNSEAFSFYVSNREGEVGSTHSCSDSLFSIHPLNGCYKHCRYGKGIWDSE